MSGLYLHPKFMRFNAAARFAIHAILNYTNSETYQGLLPRPVTDYILRRAVMIGWRTTTRFLETCEKCLFRPAESTNRFLEDHELDLLRVDGVNPLHRSILLITERGGEQAIFHSANYGRVLKESERMKKSTFFHGRAVSSE